MENKLTNAACLIRTRMLKVGFPALFSHLPEGMKKECAEKIGRYADAAMQYVSELSGETEKVRKVVIREDGFLILGIAGALSDILPEKASEYNGLLDGQRKIPCFVGLVWKLMKDSELPTAFPKYESFTKVLEKEILTHWTENDISKWSEGFTQGMTMLYEEEAIIPDKTAQEFDKLSLLSNKQCVAPVSDSDAMLQAALDAAVGGVSAQVSACTKVSLNYAQQPFMNVTTTDVQTVDLRERDIKTEATSRQKRGSENVPNNRTESSRNGGCHQRQRYEGAQSERKDESKQIIFLTLKVDGPQLEALNACIQENGIETVDGRNLEKKRGLFGNVLDGLFR